MRLLYLALAYPGGGQSGGGSQPLPSDLPAPDADPPLLETCNGRVDIALAIDVSGDQTPLLQFRSPLTQFVESVLPSPYDRIALAESSGSNVQVVTPLTNNATSLVNGIQQIGNGSLGQGRTSWDNTLQAGAEAFANDTAGVPKLLIMVSDSQPSDSDMIAAVNDANTIKNENIHILAAGMITEHDVPIQALEAISGTDGDTTSIDVDYMTLDSYQNLGLQLQSLAEATCGGSGGHTGTSGTGGGSGGAGAGTGTSGTGSSGAGTGSSGAGTGASSGTTKSTSPTPTPTPSNVQTTKTIPNPTPTPNTQTAPSTSPTQINPNSSQQAPQPLSEGTQSPPPTVEPSPFYDGKQYALGSTPDNLANATIHRINTGWWYIIAAVLAAGGAGGYFAWRKRLFASILDRNNGKKSAKTTGPKNSKQSRR